MSAMYATYATTAASATTTTPNASERSALECSPSDKSNAPTIHYVLAAAHQEPKLDELKHRPDVDELKPGAGLVAEVQQGKTLKQSTKQWKKDAKERKQEASQNNIECAQHKADIPGS